MRFVFVDARFKPVVNQTRFGLQQQNASRRPESPGRGEVMRGQQKRTGMMRPVDRKALPQSAVRYRRSGSFQADACPSDTGSPGQK
jgi:hypothetical protein